MNPLINLMVGLGCLLLAANFLRQATEPQVWVQMEHERVAVRAKTSDGKVFTIFVFDRSYLDEGDSVVGIDISKPPPPVAPHT